MNSDEERQLFERYGWQYDYVARRWEAPDGHHVDNDVLVMATVSMTRGEMEERLKRVIVEHGRCSA